MRGERFKLILVIGRWSLAAFEPDGDQAPKRREKDDDENNEPIAGDALLITQRTSP